MPNNEFTLFPDIPPKPKRGKVKKQYVVGTQKLTNSETGEVLDVTIIEKNITKDFNFHKVWLQDILNILDSIGNKKIAVIIYLLKNMRNEDNSISCTYRSIAKGAEVSLPTVQVVMQELLEANAIKKLTTGTYQFNPDLIAKGSTGKRQNLLIKYNFPDEEAIERSHNKVPKIGYKEDMN
jgi:hypothetical protein